MPQQGHHQPAQRLHSGNLLFLQLEQILELVERQQPIQQPRAVRALYAPGLLHAPQIGGFADDSQQQVGRRHQALQATVFVQDHRDLGLLFLEQLEQFQGGDCLRHKGHRAQRRLQVYRLTSQALAKQILGQDYAQDLVQAVPGHRKPGMATAGDSLLDLLL